MDDEECSCRSQYEAAIRGYMEEVQKWARASAALWGDQTTGFVPGPIFPARPTFQRACSRPCLVDVSLPGSH